MINIVVTGTRGKSSTVKLLHKKLRDRHDCSVFSKISGKDSYILFNECEAKYNRDRKQPFVEQEIFDLINRYNADINIIENQGIDPYIVKYINEILDPAYILITNIRRDHIERYGNDKDEIIQKFAETIPKYSKVFVSDDYSYINDKVEDALPDSEVIKLDPIRKEIFTQSITLTDGVSRLFGRRLRESEIQEEIDKINKRYTFKETGYGFKYLDGAGLNDIDSTKMLIDKLKPCDLSLLMYLRKDRWSRSVSFLELFNDSDLDIKKIYLVGKDAKTIKNHIRKGVRTIILKDDINQINKAIYKMDGNVMSVGNKVCEYIKCFNEYVKCSID